MSSVLLTAFEPYDCWKANSSWLTLVELTRDLPAEPRVKTRLYPVDFAKVRELLAEDLAAGYDYALHLGQAPGAARIKLEAIGINVGGASSQKPEEYQPLVADGPIAFRSQLPLAKWAERLRQTGAPAEVSYHAGTFLCNATLYLSHYIAQQQRLDTKATFIHLPLDISQAIDVRADPPTLPCALMASAVRTVLGELAECDSSTTRV